MSKTPSLILVPVVFNQPLKITVDIDKNTYFNSIKMDNEKIIRKYDYLLASS